MPLSVAVGDRHVVAERPHAPVVERAPVLGDREVVDELVVVPVVVEPGRGADPLHVPDRELVPVVGPLLAHPERGRGTRDLGVGVDRVAEVDVEVVVRGRHRPERLEGPPERQVVTGLPVARLVAREREPDRRGDGGTRSGQELAHGAAAASALNAEAVVVGAVGRSARRSWPGWCCCCRGPPEGSAGRPRSGRNCRWRPGP